MFSLVSSESSEDEDEDDVDVVNKSQNSEDHVNGLYSI